MPCAVAYPDNRPYVGFGAMQTINENPSRQAGSSMHADANPSGVTPMNFQRCFEVALESLD
jgi:hypothetical protein